MNLYSLINKFWRRSPEYNLSAFLNGFKKRKAIPEFERLVDFPRFKETSTEFLDKKIKLVDAASFLFLYKEIFEEEIYNFVSETDQPYIIDGGANIGLSVIYFKRIYPGAEMLAFEPDPYIFGVLKDNLKSFGFSDVTLLERGLWKENGQMKFYAEGSDGGRLALDSDVNNIVSVKVVSLKKYLGKPVDFLKLDIEGAETEVLEDCRDLLKNVKNIFLEYHSFSKSPQRLDVILRILKEAGFRYQIHHIGVLSKHPFVEQKSLNSMDMQLNIFGFRTVKEMSNKRR
ncbi:TPA: FkbM family methyltransferase [Patescibacteria group bacterium]|nr:FkbM family methyltransferase [Patescibacteria group bacterium]